MPATPALAALKAAANPAGPAPMTTKSTEISRTMNLPKDKTLFF
jgi:hypothetical protein